MLVPAFVLVYPAAYCPSLNSISLVLQDPHFTFDFFDETSRSMIHSFQKWSVSTSYAESTLPGASGTKINHNAIPPLISALSIDLS